MKSIKKLVSDTKSSLFLDSQKINSQRFNSIDINKEINAKESSFLLSSLGSNKCFLIVSCKDLLTIKDKLTSEFKKTHDKFNPQINNLEEEKKNFEKNFDLLKVGIEKTINDNIAKISNSEIKTEVEQFRDRIIKNPSRESKIGKINITREGKISEIDELKNNIDKKFNLKIEEIKKNKKQEIKEIIFSPPLSEVKLKASKVEFDAKITKINPLNNKIYGEYVDARGVNRAFDVSFDTLCTGYNNETQCKQSGGMNLQIKNKIKNTNEEINTSDLC
jgi:hypothetical protein